ncbi:hypothetical protein DFR24_2980 [Panacagrimonas perspica]|uniref:Phosphate-selective porin O/P n=1 Tax=Panacagrimonas perspica TaxID=381431 RepID=A0A4R7P4B5_9GAMM|nr:hypothetical protein DFR24_2980 [Panacagrimonas perspica]
MWALPFAATAQTAAVESADPVAAPAPPPIGQDPLAQRYALGQGLRLGSSGFTLGGYGELGYRDPGDARDWDAAVDALSAFLWWDGGGRWRFFSETELADVARVDNDGAHASDAELISERLYLDYAWRDELKLRFGKFLTPVGRWNLIHAAPLTWTSSRPLITEATFPTNATGAMVYGVLPWTAQGIEYSVYASPGEELFREDDLDTFREAVGARVSGYAGPHVQLGLSWATFEQESDAETRKQLIGGDFAWSWHRFELSGEYAVRSLSGREEQQDEKGYYVQAVAPLFAQVYAVGRYEAFHQSGADRDLNLYLGGLAWRPMPALVFKGEYSRATDNDVGVPDGWRASIAVLF